MRTHARNGAQSRAYRAGHTKLGMPQCNSSATKTAASIQVKGTLFVQENFRCLLAEENGESPSLTVRTLPVGRLPAGSVRIRVAYSSVNYKDALAARGHRGVVKQLPHVPGIDAAGVVEHSASAHFRVGDEVLVTGYDLGQGHWGGWSELIQVPDEWIVPLPSGLSAKEAMTLGTAGFTAAQSVMALQQNEVQPSDGEIVVTGATGGVGSIAIAILARLGFSVVAVTGKLTQHDWLLELGATRVVGRENVHDGSSRPMLSAQWAGAIDTVGGEILTSLLRSTRYGGCVTTCGLVAGAELHMTLYPFLLRGVSLCGIASADCPAEKRKRVWELLSDPWKPESLPALTEQIGLEDLPTAVEKILAGQMVGRTIVQVSQV